jgi:hypothetical protein
MARYDKFGALDDAIGTDGDYGFIGFNNRLRPDQLSRGMLADSRNMRLDRNGEAQVRKGVELIEAPFAVGGDVLRLPVTAEIDDGVTSLLPTTIESASLSGNFVSLILNDPAVEPGHSFQIGDEVTVEGVQFNTTDPNGVHTLTNVTDNGDTVTLTYALTGANEPYVTAVVLPETLPFDLTGVTTQAVVGYGMVLDQGQVTEVYASTGFSDPANNASQYILIASNLKVVAKNLTTGATTDIIYPAGETVPPEADMIQAFNKVFIFRNGQAALEWDGDFTGTPAFTKVASGEYSQPVQIVCASGEFALIQNRGIVNQSDGVSVGSTITVIGDKTLSTDQTSGLTIGAEFVVSKIFEGGSTTTITFATKTPISGGEYDGLYKVTITAAGHGKNVGDPIDIAGFGDSKIDGSRFVAEVNGDDIVFYVPQNPSTTVDDGQTVALAHGFEFYVDASKTDSHVTDGKSFTSTPVFTRKVSVGLGFSHMPSPPFATYHQRRLVMPYRFEVNDTVDSFTSRGILDEVIASDILDTDTYDRIYAQYRFNAGTADYIVGLHSFAEDSLLVFNRNSIHLVQNTINLEAASTRLLTNEVGCVARKSIKQVGNQVIFLSDNGVYGTQFLDEYNLRGTETPLSEPINETIKRINKEAWEQSVAVYFDNRYYLAVPLNKEVVTAQVGTAQVGQPGDSNFVAASLDFVPASTSIVAAQVNNAILVYNFLNQQWESVDTTNNVNWDIEGLIVAGDGSDRGVYAINQLGGIHRLDYRVDGVDRIVTAIGEEANGIDIEAAITTRQYTLGSMDRKKWKEFDMHVQSSDTNDSDLSIQVETENPDATTVIGTLSSFNGSVLPAGEDVSIRGRIGNKRGYGIQFTFNNTTGRPRIRAIEVDGSATFRSTNKAI